MYGVRKTHFSLEEYWQILGISECHGYGITHVPAERTWGCSDLWQQRERYWLSFAIEKAEHRLVADRWLGFPIRRQYEKPRQLEYTFPLYLGKYVRGVGVETEVIVESNVNVELSVADVIQDPIFLTVAVGFTDPNELLIRYPETYFSQSCRDFTIRPSCVTIADGIATIEIPRCRLLKPEYFRDYEAKDLNQRPRYDQDEFFLDTVDITRNYLDTTTGATLVWSRSRPYVGCWTGVTICDPVDPCSDIRQTACAYVREQRDGVVHVEPSVYQDGAWSNASMAVRRQPSIVEINFMRGYYERYEELDADIARAIIAIAHNNMPQDYCTCSVQKRFFQEDNKPIEPPVRLGLGPSTWGISEAAEIIREFDSRYNSHSGGML
jgi:hypothetical protein